MAMHARETASTVPSQLQCASEMWPTPAAGAFGDGLTPEKDAERRARLKEEFQGRNGNGAGLLLSVASQLWPTPCGMAGVDASGHRGAGGEFAERVVRAAQTLWNTPTVAPEAPNLNANQTDKPGSLGLQAEGAEGLWATPNTWSTPATRDHHNGPLAKTKQGRDLVTDALAAFPPSPQAPPTATPGRPSSPSARLWRLRCRGWTSGRSHRRWRLGLDALGRLTRKRLNPLFVTWLQGWPWHWASAEPTPCGCSETESFVSKLRWLSEYFTGGS